MLWACLPLYACAISLLRTGPASLVTKFAAAHVRGEALGMLDAASSVARLPADTPPPCADCTAEALRHVHAFDLLTTAGRLKKGNPKARRRYHLLVGGVQPATQERTQQAVAYTQRMATALATGAGGVGLSADQRRIAELEKALEAERHRSSKLETSLMQLTG